MKLVSESPEQTEAAGYKLGKMLGNGTVVGLYGDLGSGKTTLVRGIAKALGVESRDITSASFTIIAEYPGDRPFYHIDLYRIAGAAGLDETGIWEVLGRDSVAVVEWAENLGDAEIDNLIRVRLKDIGEERRELWIEGIDEQDWNSL